MTTTLVIIEDEKLVSSMLEACLGQIPGIKVSGTAACGPSGLLLCTTQKPDIVLLDIELPSMSGLEVALGLRSVLPRTRIVILSSHCEPYVIHELARLNVEGFIDKGSSLDVLRAAIADIMEGKTFFSEAYTTIRSGMLQRPEAFQKILSRREITVLTAVAEGLDDDAIAKRLTITPSTAATHRRNIRAKLKIHNDREMILYAREWGLVPLASRKL
jgi:DNA-binding NarL/FixJ family response regulator